MVLPAYGPEDAAASTTRPHRELLVKAWMRFSSLLFGLRGGVVIEGLSENASRQAFRDCRHGPTTRRKSD